MNAFEATHIALAALCAVLGVVHVAMGLAVRSEPAHRWVAASLIGCGLLALSVAGSSEAGAGSLGSPTPFLLLAVLTVLALPAVLTRTIWAVLDWPMVAFRRRLWLLVVLLILPTGLQIVTYVVTDDPRAQSWETARYGNVWTSAPYHVGTLMIGVIWFVAAWRARATHRSVATAAMLITAPAIGLSVRETLISLELIPGSTLLGIVALPLAFFTSVTLAIRYVQAVRSAQVTAKDAGPLPYDRLHRLGEGGMGEAWLAIRATETGFRRWVVLKQVRVDRREQHIIERFLAEARIAARLHHPNIVAVYDLHPSDEGWFMVMEYLAGPSLWDVMTRCFEEETFAPVSGVVEILEQVCQGLECAHSHGVLHRDISPDNIILTFDGQTKLLDFGIAKEAQQFDPEGTRVPVPNAQTYGGRAGVLGKAQYLAPERIGGDPASAEADIFALGLVALQLLGVPLPPRGADVAGAPNPVSSHRDDVPAELEAVVRKALAPHPKLRYGSAAEMADELRDIGEKMRRTNLSRWARKLCGGHYRLAGQLQGMRDPLPHVVRELFEQLKSDHGPNAAATAADGSDAPAPTRTMDGPAPT